MKDKIPYLAAVVFLVLFIIYLNTSSLADVDNFISETKSLSNVAIRDTEDLDLREYYSFRDTINFEIDSLKRSKSKTYFYINDSSILTSRSKEVRVHIKELDQITKLEKKPGKNIYITAQFKDVVLERSSTGGAFYKLIVNYEIDEIKINN